MFRRSLPLLLLLLASLSWWAVAKVLPEGGELIFASGFENRRPVANAGPDRATPPNQSTTLAGSGIDPDGDPLSFVWRVLNQPAGSTITLSNATIAMPSFTPAVLGNYQFELIVSDGQLASLPDTVTITASAQPLLPTANAGPPQNVPRGTLVQLSGAASSNPQGGTLSYAWTLDAQPLGSSVVLSNASAVNPSFTPLLAGLYRVQLVVNNGVLVSTPASVEIAALPPTPEAVAPPLPPTETTSTAAASAFLYTGPNPIQTDVATGAIESARGAVIRGRVITRTGAPLPGVSVQALGRPELGKTVSQADGQFDFAVNGAEQVILEFSRDGMLPVQRRASPDWQGQRGLDRLVMITPDPLALRLAPGRNMDALVAEGSVSTDRDGTRRGRLFLAPGNAARLQLRDGRSAEMAAGATLRITEYTVGTLGPNTMPAELPSTTGYTYAADISFDEMVSTEATRVTFDQPLPFYVDNFLNFPTGEVVPFGYYDRDKAEWVPSPNGRVIKVLSISAGRAVLDVAGAGTPATPAQLTELGITDAELTQLATLYTAGQSFWRSPVPFLQVRGGRVSLPWDANWPRVPPAGAMPPQQQPVQSGNASAPRSQDGAPTGADAPGEGACQTGSVIQCQRQVMMKALPVVGTPFALHYSTERTLGWRANNSAQIPLTGATLPPGVASVALELQVAGKTLNQSFPTTPNQSFSYVWNGLDAWNRPLNGAQEVRARVGYVYPATNARPGQFQQAFSTLAGVPITGNRARDDITLWQEHRFQIGAPAVSAVFGIGGFSLTPHHFYDPVRGTLFQGDGQIRDASAQSSDFNVRGFAGTASGFSGDGGAATAAAMNNPRGVAAAPDGSIYVADAFNHRVRKISRSGVITTFAGNGMDGFSGDGAAATAARLNVPADVAVDREGNVYIADSYNHRIRRVARDGTISTVAGTGVQGFAGDGAPALQAQLAFPGGVAVGPFGELYIADTFNHRIRKIGADAVITTTSGNGSPADAGDGGPAILASLQFPLDLDVSADGEQFIVDNVNHRIRKVDIGGLISTVAGNGLQGTATGVNGDGGPATQARLNFPRGVTVLADGSLLIADGSSRRIRVVRTDGVISAFVGGGTQVAEGTPGPAFRLQFPSSTAVLPDGRIVISDTGSQKVFVAARFLPQFLIGEIAIASPEADEVYRFSPTGRHLETRSTLTGALRYRFTYDSAGRLSTVVDGDGDTTRIERNATGTPTAIFSQDNLRTTLTLSNGLLTEVINPNQERIQMQYAAGGLLNRYVDARNFVSTYSYDTEGRLIGNTDAATGGLTLTRTATGPNVTVAVRTALNRITGYSTTSESSGNQARQTTFPDATRTQVAVARDGLHTTTQPDGTVIQNRSAPDPRFGVQSGYASNSQTATGGRTLTTTSQRTVTLADVENPLSLTAFNEQSTINGRSMQRSYDGPTRTWTMTSPAGRITRTVIDAQGRPIKLQATGLNDIDLTYDARGRLTFARSGDGAGIRETSFVYSPQGFLQSITDPLGRTMSYQRDAVGRTLTARRPDDQSIQFTYDASGNLATLSPAGRPEHRFSYTPINMLAGYQPPSVSGNGANDTFYTYNVDRQLATVTHANGEVMSYGYDSAGRLATLGTFPGTFGYSYSPTSGKLISITAPAGVNLGYTHAGSLLTNVALSGPIGGSVQFTYDNDFRVATERVNNGTSIAFGYDPDALLTTAGNLTLSNEAGNGLLIGTQLGTLQDTYTHSEFGEPTSYVARYGPSEIFRQDYVRDKLGRITRRTETITGTTTIFDYVYDAMGRMREVKRGGVVSATYTYDNNGNRLSRVAGSVTENGVHDNQDRLLSYAGANYTYNARGDLLTRTDGAQTTQYSYDAFGNLRSMALSDGRLIGYLIDGQNRRVGKSVNGTLVQGFLYRDQLEPIAELAGNGTVVARFVYADKINVPAYMIKNGRTYRYITDHLGSPRALVDIADGSVAQRMDFDEFGRVLLDSSPGFQPFGFAGGIYDRDTGLVRFGARDFDSILGRWHSKDLLIISNGDPNRYSYGKNDPINSIDPSGLSSIVRWYNKTFSKRNIQSAIDQTKNAAKREAKDKAGEEAFGAAVDANGGALMSDEVRDGLVDASWLLITKGNPVMFVVESVFGATRLGDEFATPEWKAHEARMRLLNEPCNPSMQSCRTKDNVAPSCPAPP